MNEHEMMQAFPNLKRADFEITSEFDEDYNCIAFAAEDEERRWWPADRADAFWPEGVPRHETVEAFVRAFGTLGYEICDGGSQESEFQKIAIYLDRNGVPTHAARQIADGWMSKLGKCEDIRHASLEALEESAYGKARVFLRKRITTR